MSKDLKKINLTGTDSKTFLQRQATRNNGYVSFLTPQAKIVALAYWQEPYLITNEAEKLKEHLEKFVITEDVEIALVDSEDCSTTLEMTDMTTLEFKTYSEGDTLIKLENSYPGILDKYVDFNKGCFPGQEVLSKYKNIGLKKKEERSKKYTDEALEIFAQAQNNNSDLDPAIELLKKAIKENPKNEDAYESFGVMLAKQEKFQEAIKVMQELEMMNPKNQMALMNLSIFYMKIGDKESAEDYKAKGTVLQFEKALGN